MKCVRICVFMVCLLIIDCSEFNFIELSHDLGPHTPFFPVNDPPNFKSTVQEAGYSRGFWLAYSEITFQQGMSTFVAAPTVYYPYGRSVDQIKFKDLFATAVVIDVREKVAKNYNYEVTIEDVENWIEQNGMFPDHCIVLFNTGWEEGRYPDQVKYFGSRDSVYEMKYPGVEFEALKFILRFEYTHGIHIVGFGIDTPTLDRGSSRFFSGIELVGNNNKYVVGNLKDLKRLPPKGAKISVMPIKIKNGEASPARVVAQLPDN